MNIIEKILNIICKPKIYVPVLSIVFGYIIYIIIKSGLNRVLKHGRTSYEAKKIKTAVDLCSNIVKIIIIVVVGIIILEVYGFDTKSIITGLGVFSAVLGLAVQDSIKDFIAGMTIILENYYIVGDIVKFGDFVGEVKELGFKSTKIKNADGDVLIIANRNVNQIINLSQSKSTVFLKLDVAYEEKVERVEEVIGKLIEELENIQFVEKKSVQYLGIDSLNDSSVKYMIKIDCLRDKQWQVKRDALRVVKIIFDKENIKIPYPQIEVHNG